MSDTGTPKVRRDGEVDGRGHGEGSRATRFAKNDGRPRPGRPKGSKDERTILRELDAEGARVTMPNGKTRWVTTREVLLMRLRQKAMSGDLKALQIFLKLLDRYEVVSTDPDRTQALLEEDRLILEHAQRRGVVPAGEEEEGR